MLSNNCEKIREKYGIVIGIVKKLMPTLADEEKYVSHYRHLQLYTDLGFKVKKVHSVLEFNQAPWVKQYIDFQHSKEN